MFPARRAQSESAVEFVLSPGIEGAAPCRLIDGAADAPGPRYGCARCGGVALSGIPVEDVNARRLAPVGVRCPHCGALNLLAAVPRRPRHRRRRPALVHG